MKFEQVSKFSVLISTYWKDSPEYVRQAMESLSHQTLTPNEVVLVKDGKIQSDVDLIIAEYSTRLQIKVVQLEKNVGLAAALNAGLLQCENDLVARMDADDFALPSRFETQVRFMDEHPDIDVSSSWMEEREDMSLSGRLKKLPASDGELRTFAKLRSPINHPCAIFRRHKVVEVGLYPLIYPEDYALWSVMMLRGSKFANIPKVLQYMRVGGDFLNRRGFTMMRGELRLIFFQRRIGFLTSIEAFRNCMFRILVRLSPLPVRRFLYRTTRV